MIRVEVTDEFGTAAELIDPAALGDLDDGGLATLKALSAGLIRDLAAALGAGDRHAAEVAVALLTRRCSDEAAYERVAALRRDDLDPQGRLF